MTTIRYADRQIYFFLKKSNCFVLFALKNDIYKTIRGNLIFF